MTPLESEMKRIIRTFGIPPECFIMHPKDARNIVKRNQAKRMIRRLRRASKVYYSQPLWLHMLDSEGNVTDNKTMLRHTGKKTEIALPFN